jgi:hypothetical protein
MKDSFLSDMQREYIIELIDIWYLKWKSRMTDGSTHNLGFAKEELKKMVWYETANMHDYTSLSDLLINRDGVKFNDN